MSKMIKESTKLIFAKNFSILVLTNWRLWFVKLTRMQSLLEPWQRRIIDSQFQQIIFVPSLIMNRKVI